MLSITWKLLLLQMFAISKFNFATISLETLPVFRKPETIQYRTRDHLKWHFLWHSVVVMWNFKTNERFKWFIVWRVLAITICFKSFLRFNESRFFWEECFCNSYIISFALIFLRELVSCDKFSKKLLMIKVLFSFSVFNFSSSLVSFCTPKFENIPEIFSFILEIYPTTKSSLKHTNHYLSLNFRVPLCFV